jgi:hypothetical protein
MVWDEQKALLTVWAEGTDYRVDQSKTNKAEFARLALIKGWVGGDETWCARWEECFGERYLYGSRSKSDCAEGRNAGNKRTGGQVLTLVLDSSSTTLSGVERSNRNKRDENTELEESMRRLSVGSDESNFSLISRTSRADSFDSIPSLDSDSSRRSRKSRTSALSRRNSSYSWDSKDPSNSVLSLDTVKSLDSIVDGVDVSESQTSMNVNVDTDMESGNEEAEHSKLLFLDDEEEGPARWYEYAGFVPEPSAPFKTEFERLARHEGWSGSEKRYHLIDILSEEVAFHYSVGDAANKLHDLQELCEDLGIKNVPNTLTRCRKVRINTE